MLNKLILLLTTLGIFKSSEAVKSTYLSNKFKYDVAVIGGGVGGLVVSSQIAQSNLTCVLLEKNRLVGGRMQSFSITNFDKFRFDIGPSLLLLPSIYNETFSSMGAMLSDYVDLLPVKPLYRCYFEEDNTSIDIQINNDNMNKYTAMKKSLESIESGSYKKFESYMNIAKAFLLFGLPTVIKEQFSFQYIIPFILACFRVFPLRSHSSILSDFFASPKIRAMLSFQDLYIGLSPYETPAVFSLLQALEFEEGIYYPKGGFQVVANALEKIARNSGVEILLNSTVTELLTDDSSIVQALFTTNNTNLPSFTVQADQYVMNMDAPKAERTFFGQQTRGSPTSSGSGSAGESKRDLRTAACRPSCSVVSLNFALNITLEPLCHHTLFLSSHYTDSWNTVAFPDTSSFDPNSFNFYVHAPSRTDSTCCPEGADAITVLVPVPPLPLPTTATTTTTNTNIDDDNSLSSSNTLNLTNIRNAVIRRLQAVPGMPATIQQHIIAEYIRDPVQWETDYSLYRGSAFGLAHTLPQLSFLRPRIRHPHYSNLYRVGASTRPGNGVPLVMIGAKLTKDIILSDRLTRN